MSSTLELEAGGIRQPMTEVTVNTASRAQADAGALETTPTEDVTIPPRDRGRAAWQSLAAVLVITSATWGFGASQGVFREYYFKNPPFEGNQVVASIGLLAVGVLQIGSPFLLRLLGSYPHSRPIMMWVGMVLVVASAIGAAFSTTALQVIMTQGTMYGLSSSLLFAPCVSFVDEWFLERRGLANGLFFGANNIAASALSPVFSILLERFGPRTTLIGWAILAGVLITLGILLVRSRPFTGSDGLETTPQPVSSIRPLKNPIFWLFIASMTLQSLANNLPANYLPSFATDLGVSREKAALLVTWLSLSGIVGQALLGALTDAIGPRIPLLLSTVVSSVAVFVIWGLGRYYWNMVIVSILFGAFAFSFLVVRSHMAAIVVNDKNRPAEELFVSGILLFTRGIISVVSGYVAAAVLETSEDIGITPGYGAGKWRPLIILMGTVLAAATIGVFGLRTPNKA